MMIAIHEIQKRRPQKGFTLIELMVVVVIIGIIASVGMPMYSRHLLKGNINQAVPVLMNIAAKNRIHYNRTGRYFTSASETEVQKRLGVNLGDTRDFCFMIFCTDTAKCGDYSGTNSTLTSKSVGTFVNPTTTPAVTPDFQVIAVLRGKTPNPNTALSAQCSVNTTATNGPVKQDPAGWVDAAGNATAGNDGRVVILSYPPPPDGFATAATINGRVSTISIEWLNGITVSDAILN